jgi:hypothetical protein
VSLALLPVTLAGYATSASPWWGAATLFAVGLVYIGVLSGLSTVVQLRAPQAYRGRVLSFFLVALGVSYPIGSLVQGPVIDRIGIGWTTAGTAVLLLVILGAIAIWRPGVFRALAADSRAADSPGPGPGDADSRAADSRAADSPGPGPGEGAPGPDQPDSVGESQSTVDSR